MKVGLQSLPLFSYFWLIFPHIFLKLFSNIFGLFLFISKTGVSKMLKNKGFWLR